jgi:teichuronic acid biosynthesis glycosyltransferase TuaC
MKLLVLAAYYPHRDYLFSGIFNERSAFALRELCESVEVLVPRPYAPPLLCSLSARWKMYRHMNRHEIRNGISVHRPAYPQIPWFGGGLWTDPGAFVWCRPIARRIHQRIGFDGIISFDLLGVGGLAWRLGRDLGIPTSGWSIGADVRFPTTSSYTRVVIRAIQNLDLVFYQSQELLEKAAELLGISPAQMSKQRHVILPRGIPAPPQLAKEEVRARIRRDWGVEDNQIVVLNIGRVVRDKGIVELLEAISFAGARNSEILCILIGSMPGLDDTFIVNQKLSTTPFLKNRVRLLPSCIPGKVWEYLCGADIFAFTSHEEGMPNSLLEAMAMGTPSIAFAIPAIVELEAGTGGLVLVPPLDCQRFGDAILRLAASTDERRRIAKRGKMRVMQRFMVCANMREAVHRLAHVGAKSRRPYTPMSRPGSEMFTASK